MTTPRAPRRIHVERTTDPAVLRWIPHHRLLDDSPSGSRRIPPDTPLGHLAGEGSVADVTVRGGAVLIRVATPHEWPQLAPRVQAALLDELDALDGSPDGTARWLLEATDPNGMPPSIAEVQRVVDTAAGSVMALHGGAMRVAAIDGDTVHLRTHGACNGCRQSDDTTIGLISPALREAYPAITSVVVDVDVDVDVDVAVVPASHDSVRSTARRVSSSSRFRWSRSRSCH